MQGMWKKLPDLEFGLNMRFLLEPERILNGNHETLISPHSESKLVELVTGNWTLLGLVEEN